MNHRARRLGSLVALVAGLLVLTGCTAPRPQVTFYGNGSTDRVAPAIWCAVDRTAMTVDCPDKADEAQTARLSLRTGDGVEISVDPDVASASWGVLVKFVGPTGVTESATLGPFTDGRLTTTVVPDPTARITSIEVQSGLIQALDNDGKTVATYATRSWVLIAGQAAPANS